MISQSADKSPYGGLRAWYIPCRGPWSSWYVPHRGRHLVCTLQGSPSWYILYRGRHLVGVGVSGYKSYVSRETLQGVGYWLLQSGRLGSLIRVSNTLELVFLELRERGLRRGDSYKAVVTLGVYIPYIQIYRVYRIKRDTLDILLTLQPSSLDTFL